ncbi:MAG: hypothetical protein IJ545_05000 [Alphaproteobacteria bacterium]|nr:hypothetical protein [Alphaproteobacteria bacterium]
MEKKQTLAVHLHLYYLEMWPEIKRLLANMGDYPYDLYVTMVAENSQIAEDIREFHRNSTIWVVENRGYDIGPFIDFLHHIDLNQYDLIMKLHTKNKNRGVDTHINQYVFNRKLWVENLTNSLIGTQKQFNVNICNFKENPELGMIGSRYLITSDEKCYKNIQSKVENILEDFCYHSVPIKFVAGTMFMCRSSLLKQLKDRYTIKDFEPTNGNIKDGTLAHIIERVIGTLAVANGYQIRGFDHNYPMEIKLFCEKARHFIYQNKITKHHNRLIKVFKLPIYHRRIL